MQNYKLLHYHTNMTFKIGWHFKMYIFVCLSSLTFYIYFQKITLFSFSYCFKSTYFESLYPNFVALCVMTIKRFRFWFWTAFSSSYRWRYQTSSWGSWAEGSSWGVGLYQCLEVGRGSSIGCLVCQYHHLESDANYYREPVEAQEEGGHMGEAQ